MTQLIDIQSYPVKDVLPILLKDETTGKNIVFGTDSYAELGDDYAPSTPIDVGTLRELDIQPRLAKEQSQQTLRTRKKAEVFTPSWICKEMIEVADVKAKTWQKYVDSRQLEITCGEAPFLVSRYDVATGELIPISKRIGILDRKLQVVNENVTNQKDWITWAQRAFQSVYGYEFQGDSLLIARINLLTTFTDYLSARWNRLATVTELRQIARIIVKNVWQMDGQTNSIPYAVTGNSDSQMFLFEDMDMLSDGTASTLPEIRLKNWRSKKYFTYNELRRTGGKGMSFIIVIGNPPYHIETDSDSSRMPPVYNLFLEEAFKIADTVIMIHPARFLFNTGFTPRAWNQKMLHDPHFKILMYEPSSDKIFPGTDIKGGIVISYRDKQQDFGEIGIFTKYQELNTILRRVSSLTNDYMNSIAYPPLSYDITELVAKDYPNSLDRLRTSAFTKLADIFYEQKPKDKHEYISIIGLLDGKRVMRYVRKDYIKDKSGILDKWSLLLPEATGIGTFGEKTATGEIAAPNTAFLQTFVALGAFDSKDEVVTLSKYIKTKFARTLLGVFKITQHSSPSVWQKVPLQDFTASSDIDWSKSIPEIDAQLYKKYHLTPEEITFIETNVKEMN